MKIFGRDKHGHQTPWDGAPAWSRELREIGLIHIMQNDIQIRQNAVMIDMLKKLKPQMSPDDQKQIDEIYAGVSGIKQKIDDAGVE